MTRACGGPVPVSPRPRPAVRRGLWAEQLRSAPVCALCLGRRAGAPRYRGEAAAVPREDSLCCGESMMWQSAAHSTALMARPETTTSHLSSDFCPDLNNLNKNVHRRQSACRASLCTGANGYGLVVPSNPTACGSFCLRLRLRDEKDE